MPTGTACLTWAIMALTTLCLGPSPAHNVPKARYCHYPHFHRWDKWEERVSDVPVFTALAVAWLARCPGVVAGTSPTEFPGPGSGQSVRQQGRAKGGNGGVGWKWYMGKHTETEGATDLVGGKSPPALGPRAPRDWQSTHRAENWGQAVCPRFRKDMTSALHRLGHLQEEIKSSGGRVLGTGHVRSSLREPMPRNPQGGQRGKRARKMYSGADWTESREVWNYASDGKENFQTKWHKSLSSAPPYHHNLE